MANCWHQWDTEIQFKYNWGPSLHFPFSFYIKLGTSFLTTTDAIQISCMCFLCRSWYDSLNDYTNIQRPSRAPPISIIFTKREMDIAFWSSSTHTQGLATTEDNLICYIFPLKVTMLPMRWIMEPIFEISKVISKYRNTIKLCCNQIQNDTILHTILHCTKWYVNTVECRYNTVHHFKI